MKLSTAVFFAFLARSNADSMNITDLVIRDATDIPIVQKRMPTSRLNSSLSFTLHHQMSGLLPKHVNCTATWKHSSELRDWTRCDDVIYWWRFNRNDDRNKRHFTLEVVHNSNRSRILYGQEPMYTETKAFAQFGEVGNVVGGRLFCAAEIFPNTKATIRKCTSVGDPIPLEVIRHDVVVQPISLSPICLRYNATRNTKKCPESIEFHIGSDKTKDTPLCRLEWACENSTVFPHVGQCNGYSDGRPFEFKVAVQISEQGDADDDIPVTIGLQREESSSIPLDKMPLEHSLYWPAKEDRFKIARKYRAEDPSLSRNGEYCEMLDSGSWKTAKDWTSEEAEYIGAEPLRDYKAEPRQDEKTDEKKLPPVIETASGFPTSKAPWILVALITAAWLLVHGL